MENNLGLISRRQDIGIGTLDLKRPEFRLSRKSADLSPEILAELSAYAEFKKLFPPSSAVGEGRSAYAQAAADSDWLKAGIPGIKAKGLVGVARARGGQGLVEFPGGLAVTDGFKYVIAPPVPDKPFIMSDRVHIGITPELRLFAKLSAPKFWFSLTREGAEREYDCQEALARYGLGLGALAAGHFVRPDGHPEVDGEKRPTGGVFLVHNPDARTVYEFSHFASYNTSDKRFVTKPPEQFKFQKGPETVLNVADLVENYIRFAVRMSEVKAQALLQAGVGRHSSHDGNFWFLQAKNQVLMSDNDTCVLLKDQPEEAQGVILLRDYATFLNKTIRNLALNIFNPAFFEALLSGSCRPVQRMLEALFKDLASASDINVTGAAITKRYVEFIFGAKGTPGPDSQELFTQALNYQLGLSVKDQQAGNTYFSSEANMHWQIAHVPFYKTLILELYKLCLKSRLPEIGFTLPSVDVAQFEVNLAADLKEIRGKYQAEFAKDIERNRAPE